MTLDFTGFCDNCEARPRLNGSATLSGTITVRTGTETEYIGSWQLVADIRLAGTFSGSVALDLEIGELGSGWLGQLDTGADTWTVFGP